MGGCAQQNEWSLLTDSSGGVKYRPAGGPPVVEAGGQWPWHVSVVE